MRQYSRQILPPGEFPLSFLSIFLSKNLLLSFRSGLKIPLSLASDRCLAWMDVFALSLPSLGCVYNDFLKGCFPPRCIHCCIGPLMARALPVQFIVISTVAGTAWHIIEAQNNSLSNWMNNMRYFWDSLPSFLQLLNENTEDRLLCVSNWRLWIREKGSGSPFLFSSLQISIPTDCLPLLTRLLRDSGTSLGRLLSSSQRKMSPLWIRALSHTHSVWREDLPWIRTAVTPGGVVQVYESLLKKLPSLDKLPLKQQSYYFRMQKYLLPSHSFLVHWEENLNYLLTVACGALSSSVP